MLVWADLQEAKLGGANLAGANLERADLTKADLQGARANQGTCWGYTIEPGAVLDPDAIDPVAAGVIFK
ncbi:MAG: pentapeptide repeat-containing protein [Acidimicrobiales bacterium]|jgi:uncharacterized protein YjbI with pentapeptide repeats|nr:pentapeptide repeat-containing protein [Acidimicrobiales bacterium]MEE1571575.1 pentapeptide repeat-containing protein [Acidimicrobiales bacterium]|tara:strand:+ start:311 stop:517 length:207 start_codon:yes stop_codon:yes gene_type:complete